MALISHTGGTTGEPKGVMCSDYGLNALMVQIVCNFKFERNGCSIASLPPFVNYSLAEAMMAMLVIGYKVVLIPKYEPSKLYEYIGKYRPTIILSIPAYWNALYEAKKEVDMSVLEQAYYGGEGMSEENEKAVTEFIRNCGARTVLCKGLGATEMMAGATQSYPECNPIGSVGIPLVRTNCLVEDVNTGEELPYYEIGELCFQGPTLMLGYYGQPDATDEVIKVRDDGKRWFCSGDLGYVTEDGIVYVTGRIKRIIMTKGRDEQVTKMFPDRIEKAIYACDSVELCCVIGVPDEKRINYPKAYVVLKKGQQKEITEEAILRQCRQNLPEYMVPEEISFVDDLPRTSRGKVDYRALEENNKY
jgi:long-chain acyl-CoA synthetase